MSVKVLIVHADGEESQAKKLADPIRKAGYEPVYYGTILVGDSFTEQASQILAANGPLVLCGTSEAVGTGLAHRLIHAARAQRFKVHIFPVRMEAKAYLEALALDAKIAEYARNPAEAIENLIKALTTRCPPDADTQRIQQQYQLESRYRDLVLKACDIVDLSNLPEDDRHLASRDLELRRLYVALRLLREMQEDDEDLRAMEQRRTPAWGSGRWCRTDEERRVSLGERLGAVQRLVVLGDPGAGKSTLLRWLATVYLLRLQQTPDWRDLPDVESLPNRDWLPILIRCRDLPSSSYTLDDMLRHGLRGTELAEDQCNSLRPLLRAKLEQGKAMLLVDGLDEIGDAGARARFARQLEQICRAIDRAPIVVTSRIVGYRELGGRIRGGFEHLTVAALSREDKDDFARRWCTLTERPERRHQAASQLIDDIHASDRIERLTGNPMLLTTMALIKRRIGRLPQRRVDLYEKAVEVMLIWRSQVDVPLDPREALPQLEYLAHAMCAEGIHGMPEDQALDLLRQVRKGYPHIHALHARAPEEFLTRLEQRTGLLIQSGHVRRLGRSVPVYEFRHVTFQEYLAGMALVRGHYRGWDNTQSLAEAITPLAAGQVSMGRSGTAGKPAGAAAGCWHEALRLCLAACHDDAVDAALQAILYLRPGETDTARARAVLASLCLADEPNASDDVAHEVLQTLATQVRKHDGGGEVPTDLDAAAQELAATRWAGILGDYLLDEFFRREPEGRYAPGGLYAMVQATAAPIGGDKLSSWLETWASRLAQGSEREAVGVALTLMHMTRVGIECWAPKIVDGLTRRLSGSAPTSHAASWALCWISYKRYGEGLRELDPAHLDRVLWAASQPGCDSEGLQWLSAVIEGLRTPLAVDPLLRHLPAGPPRTREAIAKALGAIGDKRGLEHLRISLEDSDELVRRAALRGLTRTYGDEVDRRLLERDLREWDPTWGTGLDPQSPIGDERITEAASRLKIPAPEIRERYARLAEGLGLRIEPSPGP